VHLSDGGRTQQLGDVADAVCGQFDGQLDDALIKAHVVDDAQALDQAQHRRVVGEHQGGEAPDALVAGAVREGLGELGADTVSLPIVGDRDSELGAVGMGWRADLSRDADSLAGGRVDRHERFVIVVVDLGEVGELGGRQRAVR
jgi:hypothetical protein